MQRTVWFSLTPWGMASSPWSRWEGKCWKHCAAATYFDIDHSFVPYIDGRSAPSFKSMVTSRQTNRAQRKPHWLKLPYCI